MAQVPYSGVPSVQPQGPAGVMEHAQASPQDFGSGVGQAEENLGNTGMKVSDAIAANAVRMQEQINDRDANQQINGYMTDAGKEMAKYDAMEGQAAHDYYPTFQKNLADLRNQYGANLQSPAARLQYDNYSRFMTTRYYTSGAEKSAQGLKESYKTTAAQTMDTSTSQGILAATRGDMPTVALQAARMVEQARQLAVNVGGQTPEQADNTASVTRSNYFTKVIHDLAETGHVDVASKIYNTVRPTLDANAIGQIDQLMKAPTDRMTGDQAAQTVYGDVIGVNSARADPAIRGAIVDQANKSGIDPSVPLTIAHIESRTGGVPDSPGNSHQGVFQLGPQEWSSIGGTAANRGDRLAQAQLGTQWVAGAQKAASAALGRPAEGWETYMVHQQGTAGGAALLTAPQGESAVDALAPAYGGNRARATQAITNNGGTADMTAGQFNQLWQAKYASATGASSGGGLPTSSDARQPLTGDQIIQATQRIEDDPSMSPEAKQWAHGRLEQRLSAYNQALRADAEHAINGIVTKALQNPYSVSMSDIATNPSLTGPEKASLSHELVGWQSGKAQGDGDGFGDVVDRIQAPVGSDTRLNSLRDLVPMLGHGLTYAGLDKAQKFMKDRDAPDGPTMKAAMDTWKSQILGGAIGDPKFATPASRQRWVDFLAAVQPQIDQAKGKMPMADIVGANGPVQKMIDSGHYVLSAEEMFQSMVPGTPGGASTAPVTPTVGRWYMPVGNFSGQFREVPAGTAGARRLTAPTFAPENFENPNQLPSAPTSG